MILYLGNLAVVPQHDVANALEKNVWNYPSDIELALENTLSEIFKLPPLPQSVIASPTNDDLVIDIFLCGYRTGQLSQITANDFALPMYWRPKIEINARLYRLKSGSVVKTFKVTKRPSCKHSIMAGFSLHNQFSFGPMFNKSDMDILLNRASITLLEQIKNTVENKR